MEIIVIALILLTAVLVILLFKRQQPQSAPDYSQSILMMQQHIEALRGELSQSLKNTGDTLSSSMKSTQDAMYQSLKITTETVNQQLGVVTNQLSSVTQQLQNNTGQMGTRLDNATNVIREVQTKLGELGKATQEIKELGQSVSKLEEMLRAPKLRGGLGELLLEDLLKQVLPNEHFEMQYRFRNGQTVDAIIRTADGMVPIDSKFPLENFRKMVSANDDPNKKAFQKTFLSDVKKHIDAIATKYILPDEGTFPFALMYIPAENIYYEIIIKDESTNGADVYGYALERKVVPVSPNSFYAYLQVIALGLRGLRIEQSAREILDTLSRLQGDMTKVRDAFNTLGAHLDNAHKKYEEADKRLSNFEDKLESVAEKALPQTEKSLTQEKLLQ